VQPDTSYASLDGDRIGYQVFGHGPPDVVTTIGSYSHMDLVWEDPGLALYFRSLGSFSRVIRFDRRGTGVSDHRRLELLPPWESWAEELAVVLDAVGSQRAAIIAQVDAGPMALMFASTRPERPSALVLVNTTARWAVADDYPIGLPREVLDARLRRFDQLWGTEAMAASLVPSRADDAQFRRWWARLQRAVGPPGAMAARQRALAEIDARPLLPLVQAPTLILHRRNSAFVPIAMASTWPTTSPARSWSSCQESNSRSSGRPPSSPWVISRSSSPEPGMARTPPGSWRRCCSPTSLARPNRPAGWVIAAGASC
jgi:pimeloyl-ACP methyl ester carboxylesterase